MILPFTCYCSRGDLLSHTVWPKYFCFIAILMGLTISLFCLHDWLSKVSSESFCMATSQMPANVKYFYLGKILNNNKEYFATYLINWQQVSKMTVFGKSISGRVSLKKRLKSGKKLHIRKDTSAERYTWGLEQHALVSRQSLFQRRPCIFQQDHAKCSTAFITTASLHSKKV